MTLQENIKKGRKLRLEWAKMLRAEAERLNAMAIEMVAKK